MAVISILNTIFLIVGRSGSGKTTLCDQLSTISGLKVLESYTTRKPRYEGERGHIFVSSLEEWSASDDGDTLVAYTVFDGNQYWATSRQVDENDLYVIDPDGVEFLQQNYLGNKDIKIIYIDATWRERFLRMRRRGDGMIAALRRIWNDARKFQGWAKKADFVVRNHDLTESFTLMHNYINQFKRKPDGRCEKYDTSACLTCEDGYTDDGAIYCGRKGATQL